MVASAVPAPVEQPFFALDPVAEEVSFGSPRRQSRVTVLFRPLLVVPHVIVMLVLTLVAVLLVIVGWFAALFLGRLPRWIARYEMGVISYAIRVSVYQLMLADKFPPFGFSAPGYSVDVKIGASRLSRLKVFFRRILSIPADIVLLLAVNGLSVLGLAIWLVTLVRGQVPRPMFSAAAAVTRYQARYYAYMGLVTDEYPRRLFGDRDSDWAPEGFRLQLSDGAKWIMRVLIVLGIAVTIASIALPIALGPHENSSLVAAENRLESATLTHVNAIQGCRNVRCLRTHERAWSSAFDRFASDLSGISFSGVRAQQASALAQDSRMIGQALVAASKSKTADENVRRFQKAQHLLNTFEADAKALLGHGL
jgi:hypothetical protein